MSAKKTYIKPELVSHGTINELTNGIKFDLDPGDGDFYGSKDNPIGYLGT